MVPIPARKLALLGSSAFFLLFVVHWIIGGASQVLRYQAADAFYYYTVAVNAVDHHVVGYDQFIPSNGFHPLWQLVTIVLYVMAKAFPNPQVALLYISTVTCLLLLTGALYIMIESIAEKVHFARTLLIILPVGLYGIVASAFVGGRAILWSQVNGLETSLSLFLFAAWLAHSVSRSGNSVVNGFLLSILILSRLDTVFLLPALVVVTLVSQPTLRDGMRRIALQCAPPVVTILGYVLVNRLYWGTWLPVSGSAKSTFPALNADNIAMLMELRALVHGPHFHRAIALILPLVAAFCFVLPLFKLARVQKSPMVLVLLACNLFVIARHLHDLTFVSIRHIGEWYYAISQVIISLTFIVLIDPACGRLTKTRARVLVSALIALEALVFTVLFGDRFDSASLRSRIMNQEHAVQAFYENQSPRFIAVDDGITAFAFGFPTVSAFGLNLDPASFAAWKSGKLAAYSYARGFNHVIVSEYTNASAYTMSFPQSQQLKLRRELKNFALDVKDFDLSPEYLAADQSFAIFKMESRNGTTK